MGDSTENLRPSIWTDCTRFTVQYFE